VTKRFHPEIARNNLVYLIRPQVSAFLRLGVNRPIPENRLPADSFSGWVTVIFSALLALLLPSAFEIQAYIHLFSVYGSSDPVLWASLVISAALMCCNYRYIVLIAADYVREFQDESDEHFKSFLTRREPKRGKVTSNEQ
jgi:hypothetical protein